MFSFMGLFQECGLAQGKVLGGTGSINCMVYIRGSRYDYDRWKKLGCHGWGYADVLPYFLKSETNTNPKFIESGETDIFLSPIDKKH